MPLANDDDVRYPQEVVDRTVFLGESLFLQGVTHFGELAKCNCVALADLSAQR